MIPGEAIGAVRETFERCQRRYPTIDLPFETFLVRSDEIVSACLEAGAMPPECPRWLASFAQLYHEDLFLATACAQGNRIAWEYLADEYLPLLRRLAAQACRNLDAGEDLAQELITTLLGDPGSSAQANAGRAGKLAGYSGRSALATWLRVTVSHAAIDRFRRMRKEFSLDELDGEGSDGIPHTPAAGADGNAEALDSRWGPVLSQILSDEIERLPARDRLLLSLYYLRGVSLKSIGRQFRVHEATASRWLENLRRGIRKRIERELRKRHGLRPSEIQSLWHWASEQEDFSLEKVLDSRL